MRNLIALIIFFHISSYALAQKKPENNLLQLDDFLYANINKHEKLEHNNIYKRGNTYAYSYKFWDKNGKELLFTIRKDNSWSFIDKNQVEDNVVKDFKLEILNSDMNFSDPVFYQTGISYIVNKNSKEQPFKTGLIENEKNIWIHPPREYLFQILQLNPYPFIKYPLEIGRSWSWKLQIGSAWGDKRWKEWEGIVEFSYRYRIIGKEEVKTGVGNFDCFIIESEAISHLGKTKLTSYFSPQEGFVKLDYTNIDNSKLEIILQRKIPPMPKFFSY